MLLQENKSGMLRTLEFWIVSRNMYGLKKSKEARMPSNVAQLVLLRPAKMCPAENTGFYNPPVMVQEMHYRSEGCKILWSNFLWSNFMIQGSRSRHTV